MDAVSFTRIGTFMKASKTKIAAALLLIVLGIVLFPGMKLNAAEEKSGNCGANGDNVTWTLDDEGTLIISGTGATKDYKTNDRSPFDHKTDIKKVVIESGVTSIGYGLFLYCSNLTEVSIPDSVTSIGTAVFYQCTSLKNITIPNSVTSIGTDAFGYCTSLTSITIPNSVTSIGEFTFEYCTNLKNITISNSLTSIGTDAFGYCTSLTSVTIPNSVTSIGDYAFEYCTDLTNITIPNSVTAIGMSAFSKCSSLTGIIIPKSVYSIGASAFLNCSNLTSITIKKSLYEQSKKAFPGISSDKFHFYYDLKYTTDGNGIVMGPSDTFDSSAETLTMSPATDYATDKVTWSDGIGEPVELKAVNGKYTMPKPSDGFDYESDTVTISVTFRKVNHEITFENYDGTVLEKKKVPEGETPEYTGTITPEKPSAGGYSFEFIGWEPELAAVTGPATYTAAYTKKEIEYKVTFVDDDGVEICSDTVKYHEVPVFNGNNPVRKETDTHTFTFVGWSDGKTTYSLDQGLPQIESDTTFTPVFDPVVKPVYTVGEVKGDGINSDIVIDVHRNVDDENCLTYFLGAAIDGTEMKVNDQYTATKGSTIITIKKDYASTLSAGEHEVTVNFNDGSVSTKVTIAAKTKTNVFDPVVKPVYTVGEVKGDGINSDIVIDVHRNVDDENCLTYFLGATIDGTEMKANDQYTATKGSTIITIKKDFLSTLSSGEHEVTVNFNDGSITAEVTIAAKTKTNTSVPSTGEVTGPAAYIGLTFVAAACACGAGIVLLKKRKEA